MCAEMTTPRVFGGKFNPSEYLSVSMDSAGNMLAGGYTQDATIFIARMREYQDDEQTTVPILAYYPADNFEDVRLYQVYIWPTGMPIGISGRVVAVSTLAEAPVGDVRYSVLLDQKDVDSSASLI